jgi:hypothetical protein
VTAPELPSLEEIVLAEAKATFPLADCRMLWVDRSGDRAVGVVDVVHDEVQHLHQVCCLREGAGWFPWTEGPAPGWLDVDETLGLVMAVDVLEDGTTAVELAYGGDRRIHEVAGSRLFQVLWDVSREDEAWVWPMPVRIHVDGRWWAPALPGVPVRTSFLVDTYLRYGESDANEHFWAWQAVDAAVGTDPEQAWSFVREALRAAPDDRDLFYIAAGPLEDLIENNLEGLIDEIEAEATRSRRFRQALGGVWTTVQDEALARRLADVTETESDRLEP